MGSESHIKHSLYKTAIVTVYLLTENYSLQSKRVHISPFMQQNQVFILARLNAVTADIKNLKKLVLYEGHVYWHKDVTHEYQ